MSNLPWLAWLLLVVPLAGGAGLTVAGRRLNRSAPAVGVTIAGLTFVLGWVSLVTRPAAEAPLFAGISAGVRMDGLSVVMVLAVTAVTLAVLVFSLGEFDESENQARFFGLMLLFAGAMLVTVTATTLALLLMGWEVMGATSYALIGFWWREPRRVTAANTAFLTTRAADLGLYVAAGAGIAGGVRGLALADLPHAVAPWLSVVTAGIVVAALGKSAQLPFSFWLSRAMQGPSPVSALLHSATMVAAGAYLLFRLRPLLVASAWGEPTVAWVGVVTALALGLVAIAQTDLKQLLAASTSAQVGFMVLAAGVGGVVGGVTQLVAHAATKSLLFLAAGAWLTALGTKQLVALRGAARQSKLVGVTFTVGAFALAGLPPASLWLSKDELLAAVVHRSTALYVAGLAAMVVAAGYSAKAAWYVWQPLPADAAGGYDTEREGTRRFAGVMRGPLIVMAVLAAVLGVLALPSVAAALQGTLGVAPEPSSTWWQLTLSAALALTASGLTWWWGARPVNVPAPVRGWLARWLDLERAAGVLLVRPTLVLAQQLATFDDRVLDRAVQLPVRPIIALAQMLAAFDDRVLDRAVQGIANGGMALGHTTARIDDAGLDRLVAGLASGTRRLGQLARRPQTGQLHTYYAQAAVGFALLTLVFVFVR